MLTKRIHWALVLISVILILALMQILIPSRTSALSGSEFQAGRIIDDSVFYNNATMSSAVIQQFLNSKVPVCDTNGTQPYAGTTRAAYGTSRGYPPPYICLKDYSQSVPAVTNSGSDLCPGSITAGTKSASQIIYDVSQACGVNPQVLIVLLQKEQSLVTDDWPWSIQYRSATGYGCPDTAPCDSEYYGFFNQVYQAAKAFKRYRANPTSYNYRANRNNNILWHPNNACGSSSVFIENQATAGLYIYTPYRPNQAALNNLYGTGDGCSSYGNRNFWRMFNDWFGKTTGPDFAAELHSKSSYQVINSGESKSVYLQFKNIGRTFWKDDLSTFPGFHPVHIAATNPINRSSPFSASNWQGPSRATGFLSKVYESDGTTLASDQHTVQPGQIGRFEFTIFANPSVAPGVYREYFQPILEGAPDYYWNMGGVSYIDVGIHKPIYKAQYHSQSSYPIISPDFSHSAFLQFKNVGTETWYDDTSVPSGKRPVHLATSWPINRASRFADGWSNAARPNVNFSKVYESNGTTLAANQHVVLPGQIARFEFSLKNYDNLQEGFYPEYFEPILEGAPEYLWNMGSTAWLNVGIPAPINEASYYSQSNYPTLQRGGAAATVNVQFKNTGNTKWYDDTSVPSGKRPVHLATSWPINRASRFADGWSNAARPNVNFSKVYESNGTTLAANQHVVLPGQIARFEFSLKAPSDIATGSYKEYFEPIVEGAPDYSWNMNAQVWLGVTVTN